MPERTPIPKLFAVPDGGRILLHAVGTNVRTRLDAGMYCIGVSNKGLFLKPEPPSRNLRFDAAAYAPKLVDARTGLQPLMDEPGRGGLRLLVTGEPGSGKTSFLDRMAADWAQRNDGVVIRVASVAGWSILMRAYPAEWHFLGRKRRLLFRFDDLSPIEIRWWSTAELPWPGAVTLASTQLMPEELRLPDSVLFPSHPFRHLHLVAADFLPTVQDAMHRHLFGKPLPAGWRHTDWANDPLSLAWISNCQIQAHVDGTTPQEVLRQRRHRFQGRTAKPIGYEDEFDSMLELA